MVEPSTKLTVTLTAQQWDLVLSALGEQPFRVVAVTLSDIKAQCDAGVRKSLELVP